MSWALFFFVVSLPLILVTDVRLALCLLTGAVGMILSRVLSMDEAYRAVGWRNVFLLVSLIPLVWAAQNTGAAEWIAQGILTVLNGWPIWSLQAGVAILPQSSRWSCPVSARRRWWFRLSSPSQ